MKIIFNILVALFFSLSVNSTNIPLKEIKDSTVSFLQTELGMDYVNSIKESIYDDSFNNNIWETRKNESITDGMNGVFLISLSPHLDSYFLLVEDDSLRIINMRKNLLDDSMKILLDFLERNKNYNKEDVIFYMKELMRINQRNLKKGGTVKLYKDLVSTPDAALKIAEVILDIAYNPSLRRSVQKMMCASLAKRLRFVVVKSRPPAGKTRKCFEDIYIQSRTLFLTRHSKTLRMLRDYQKIRYTQQELQTCACSGNIYLSMLMKSENPK
jgi:hypothetical protein